MVHPEGCRLLCQAMLDAVLECPDCPLYLPIGFALSNGNVVVDNPFAELHKAICKFSMVVYPNIAWLAPVGKHIIAKELSNPLAV